MEIPKYLSIPQKTDNTVIIYDNNDSIAYTQEDSKSSTDFSSTKN